MISQGRLKLYELDVLDVSLKIINVGLQPYLPGVSELTAVRMKI